MTYVLETITPVAIKKIFADADPVKQSHLRMRRGHFSDGVEYEWAIDHEKNSYLMAAPKFETMSLYTYFYFYFEEKMYGLRMEALVSTVMFDDPPSESRIDIFQKSLIEAFMVFQSTTPWKQFLPCF